MTRRTPGRATRQILSGSQLHPPEESVGERTRGTEPLSIGYWYLVGLAILVILSALVWAIWGLAAASAIILILAIGLVASWIVL